MTRVLLTGSTGFVGSHIYEHIMKTTDWTIVLAYRNDIAGSLQRLSEIMSNHPEWYDRTVFFRLDLRDSIHELTSAQLGSFDYIIHVAASSHVDRSIVHPKEFFLDNTMATINLLDFARTQKQLKRFLYFSTDEVYGNALGTTKHTEEYPHRPRNPYAASKAAAEDACYSYHITYGVPLLITNTMNIIGERQHPEKYVPLVMGKILSGELLSIHSDPSKTKPGQRHYLHARNAAAGMLYVLEHGVVGERYNVVGEVEYDNLQIAKEIERYVQEYYFLNGGIKGCSSVPLLNYELVDFHSSRPGHDLRYSLDGTKLRTMGYEHPMSFSDSLKKTVFWTLDNMDRWLLIKQ